MFEVIHPPSCNDAIDDDYDNRSYGASISGDSLRSFKPSQFGMIKISGHDGYFHANTKGKNKMLELILNQEQYNKQAQQSHNEKREETESSPEDSHQKTRTEAIDDDEREKTNIEAKCSTESQTNDVTILGTSRKDNEHEPVARRNNDPEKDNAFSNQEQVFSPNIKKASSNPSKRSGICDDSYTTRSMTGLVSNLMESDDRRASRSTVLLQLSKNPTDTTTMSAKYKRLHHAQLSPGSPKIASLSSNLSEDSCQSSMSILSSQKRKAYNMIRRFSSFNKGGHVKPSRSMSSSVLGTSRSDAAVMMSNKEEKSCLSPSSVASTRKQMSMKRKKIIKHFSRPEPAHKKEEPILLTRHRSLMNGGQKNLSLYSRSPGVSKHSITSAAKKVDDTPPATTNNSTPPLAAFLRRHRSANPSVSSRWSASKSNTTPIISNAWKSERPVLRTNDDVDGDNDKCCSGEVSHIRQVQESEVIEGTSVCESVNKGNDIVTENSAWCAESNESPRRLLAKCSSKNADPIAKAEEIIPTKVSWMELDKQNQQSFENGERMSRIDDGSVKSCKSRSSSVLSFLRSKRSPPFRSAKKIKSFMGRSIDSSPAMMAVETSERAKHVDISENNMLKEDVHTKLAVDGRIVENNTEDPNDQEQIPSEVMILQQTGLAPNEKQEDISVLSVPPTPALAAVMSETSLERGTWADLKFELEKKLDHRTDSPSKYQKQARRTCGFEFDFGKCLAFDCWKMK